MNRPTCIQVETHSSRGTARLVEGQPDWQKDCQAVRWRDKKTTQETQDKRVLSGGSKKGLTAVHFPGTRGLSPSGTSERPSPRPGPSTDIRGASQVPGWARPSPKTEF